MSIKKRRKLLRLFFIDIQIFQIITNLNLSRYHKYQFQITSIYLNYQIIIINIMINNNFKNTLLVKRLCPKIHKSTLIKIMSEFLCHFWEI